MEQEAEEIFETTTEATEVVRVLLNTLNERGLTLTRKHLTLQALFDRCHLKKDAKVFQNAICNLGGIQRLTALAEKSCEQTLLFIFTVLGQIGFNNHNCSKKIGEDDALLQFVFKKLKDPDSSSKLKQYCIFSVTNAVANVWSCHDRLKILFEPLVTLMRNNNDKGLISQCVLTLGNFAYNDASREGLLAAGALEPLSRIVESNDPDLLPTSAALAVANLFGGKPHPSLTATVGVMDHICQAFKATLKGQDYPAGSSIFYADWKLAKGLNFLSQAPESRNALRECGLIELLDDALKAEDPRTVKNVQQILWTICDASDEVTVEDAVEGDAFHQLELNDTEDAMDVSEEDVVSYGSDILRTRRTVA